VGWTLQVPILVVAMACFGFFKGIYDANIWASLHDVVPAQRRATAVGVMNSLGWLSGGISRRQYCVGVGAFRHERLH
jgi:MFS family permease